MRLALVGPTHPYKGGIAQHTTALAHRLVEAGHVVQLVSWSAQYPARLYPGQQRVDPDKPELPPFAKTTYPLAWNRPDSWLRVGRSLREVDAVVVVWVTPVQGPPYATLLRSLKSGPKRLGLAHNVLPHESRPVDRGLTKAVFKRLDGLLVHSDSERNRAHELTDAKIGVASMPPHLPAHATGPRTDRATTRNLLFFGLVRPYKGLDVLVDALALAPDDVTLTVAGEFWGESEQQTREQVARLGLTGRVDLRPGYVPADELNSLFLNADALVLPYRASTSSQQAHLAFEHGIPVVATRVGTMADHVHEDVDGLLVPPDDAAALGRALTRLYEPGVLDRLRSNVRPPDTDAPWRAYVKALTDLAAR